MNFAFEDLHRKQNFVDNRDSTPGGLKRFTPSPMATSFGIRNIKGIQYQSLAQRSNNYIFATGVNHNPLDWTGYQRDDIKNIFDCIPRKVYKDLRKGTAMFLIDQSLEGYHTDWLFDFIYKNCKQHRINPRQIVYVSGNLLLEKQHLDYCVEKNIQEKIHAFGYPHFEEDMLLLSESLGIKSRFDKVYNYKKKHLKNIKTFCLLQKRMRPHRPWFFALLAEQNLLDKGLINMDKFQGPIKLDGKQMPDSLIDKAQQHLPLWIDDPNTQHSDDHYIRRITKNYFDNSWVSIVSEASYQEQEQTIFISEKTFKPIICHQPFFILGSKNSLEQLRDMGYKTFEPFIDVTYDKLNSLDRMNAIITAIKKIDSIEDKLEWYKSMQDILEHNYENLLKNAKGYNKYTYKLNDAYREFFA